MMRLSGVTLMVGLAIGSACSAQDAIASYSAMIAPQDRVNSSGVPLEKLEQFIAQDRANFHRFGIRQPEDEGDPIFGDREHRAQISSLLANGSVASEARSAIMSGVPSLVQVTIYGQGARPRSMSVALATPSVAAAPAEQASPRSSGTWQYAPATDGLRGVAQVQMTPAARLALECVSAGADASLVTAGATAGLHQSDAVIMLVSASAVGVPLETPNGAVVQVSLSIDGGAAGTAPMKYMTASGDLATSIPMSHPVFDAIRAGNTIEFTPSSGAGTGRASLSGSDAAIGALLEFCTAPAGANDIASLPSMSGPETSMLPDDVLPGAPSSETSGSGRPEAGVAADTTADTAAPAALVERDEETRPTPPPPFSDPQEFSLAGPSVPSGPRVEPEAGSSGARSLPQASSTQSGQYCETEHNGREGNASRVEVLCYLADGSPAGPHAVHAGMVQLGLRLIGCPVPELTGDLADSREAVGCFKEMFELSGLGLSVQEAGILRGASQLGEREKVMAVLLRRGYDPDARAKQEAKARSFIEAPDHPDQELFQHPEDKKSFLAVVTELGRWVTSRYGARPTQARWADPSRFVGRTFSMTDKGNLPVFLVTFGSSEAEVLAYDDGEMNRFTAPYMRKNRLECMELSGAYAGECLSMILASPGVAGAPWSLHGALVYIQNGYPVPIGFGEAIEGREAFEAAVAARQSYDADVQSALASGVELDALPVEGLSGPGARAAGFYDEPSTVEYEGYLFQRLPFLAYHRAYAVACEDRFRGPSRLYQVVGRRIQDSSYIPFQKYEIWENYVADEFLVQESAYQDFARGMDELIPSIMREASDIMADNIPMVDRMRKMDLEFNSWTVFHSELLGRIGCSGPTVARYEEALREVFRRSRPI